MLPPKVAQTQVVIIMIEKAGEDNTALKTECNNIFKTLKSAGVRVEFDDRTVYKSGWKFNHWEQRGVHIRLELGKRDLD